MTRSRHLFSRRRVIPAAALLCAAGVAVAGYGEAPRPIVSVFPVPGGRVASPDTQITFRGIAPDRLGRILVSGSRTGRHLGRVEGDSDGRGGSFLPSRPFSPGEVVTVHTGLRVRGGHNGTFSFRVATPAGAVPMLGLEPSPRVPGDVLTFQSRPDLVPAAVEITSQRRQPGQADIFVTPQQGPVQNGPMVLAPDGTLLWFHPVPKGDMAANLRVQRYRGRPVLTWWQGYSGAGLGIGEDEIFDTSYRQVAVVHAGNGLSADLHEFALTRDGDALITAYYPVYWNLSPVGGPSRAIVLDSVVQKIDVRTGLVVFQWDSLDHVPLTDSYEPLPANTGHPYDYFHVNSVQAERSGDLIISGRNTWAAYEVTPTTGRVIWTLGGKHSSFTLAGSASFAFQHDVRGRPGDARTMTVFDNGGGPPAVHQQSRGLTLKLNLQSRTATLLRADQHSPPLQANFEGDVQALRGGYQFLGWGQRPYFSEFDASGEIVFDGRFVSANSSYRAYRFPWTGTPSTRPAAAASSAGGTTTVYVSWNGATGVSSWRLLAGPSASRLQTGVVVPKHGFETTLTTSAVGFLAVQALDSQGRVLATSDVIPAS